MNRGCRPQVHRFYRNAPEPFHVLVFYSGFYVTIIENQVSQKHIAKLYYRSSAYNQNYCIGHTTISSPFWNIPAVLKEFRTLPNFENRTNQDELIPL